MRTMIVDVGYEHMSVSVFALEPPAFLAPKRDDSPVEVDQGILCLHPSPMRHRF